MCNHSLWKCITFFFFITLQEKKQKEALTRKQEKNRSKITKEDDTGPTELLQKPKDYIVKFSFPDPTPLQPPILGLHSKFLQPLLLYICILICTTFLNSIEFIHSVRPLSTVMSLDVVIKENKFLSFPSNGASTVLILSLVKIKIISPFQDLLKVFAPLMISVWQLIFAVVYYKWLFDGVTKKIKLCA